MSVPSRRARNTATFRLAHYAKPRTANRRRAPRRRSPLAAGDAHGDILKPSALLWPSAAESRCLAV
jgi:hypothetical protein